MKVEEEEEEEEDRAISQCCGAEGRVGRVRVKKMLLCR